MPRILVKDRDGTVKQVEVVSGKSLMQNLRDRGFDNIQAVCGGCCSCATCHVYIEAPAGAVLPPVTDEENDLLDCSDHRRAQSRLACQIPINERLEGMAVEIAAED